MNSRLAQVRSVVMDRSTPPIQYPPRNASSSKVSVLLMLQRNGNMQEHFALRDRSILDGIKRDAFFASSGVDRSTLYKVLGGGTVKRHNAELIAAGLGKPFEKVFEDKTIKRGSDGCIYK
ncbi:MAG: hypothetical protein PUC20_05540 [Firmicutes bacterium]|nr:hypothetical protein [Bacillota bacterium]